MKYSKHITFIFGIVIGFALINPFVYASDNQSLKGIEGIGVLIEDINPEIEKDGLKKDQIQKDVELKLRMAGIKVIKDEELNQEIGNPYLYIITTILKTDTIYIFSISVEFIQNAILERNLEIKKDDADENKYSDVTWSTGYLGGTSDLDEIGNSIEDRIDEFIDAYLSVN